VKHAIIIAALLICVVCSGCATGRQFDANAMMQQYYTQQRTYEPLTITGIQTFSLVGSNMTFATSATLDPLSVRAQTPSVAEKTLDVAGSVIKAGIVGHFANESIQALSVTRDPMVVRPEVIEVGP